MKVVVAAFNQEKALVGAFSVITNLLMDLFQASTCLVPHLSHASRHAPVVSGLVLAAGAGGPRVVTSATSEPL